jgi:hypothetical protein
MTWLGLKHVLVSSSLIVSLHISAVEHIKPTPYSTLEKSDFERLLPNDEITQLLAGDTEFLSLSSEYMSAQFRGVVLLIPDWEKSPTNSDGMSFLRKNLNDLGYTTYAMTVPDIDWQAVAPMDLTTPTPTETPTSNSDNKDTTNTADEALSNEMNKPVQHHVGPIITVSNAILDNYKLNLIARYEALYENATQQPANIVVIAQGASAGALLEYYADFPDTTVDAFISLSSYLPNAQRNQGLNQTTSLVSPALLDVYYASDNEDILMGLKDRQRWVHRNNKFDYRQRELFGFRNQPDQQQRLIKEIDGFLRRLF